jgi:GNAT superfamily N-acetyltransferase
MIAYRPMKAGDIAAGLVLCRANGWNQLIREWELFLRAHPDGCRVAVDELDNVRGTVATMRYDHFSWIGMVLVDPEWQRQGIGRQLLHEAFGLLKNDKILKLDATPGGRAVYVTLNFTDEYNLTRMHVSDVASIQSLPSVARPLLASDFPQLLRMDAEIFGADRRIVLEWIWEGSPECAFVVEEGNQITGYCFGRPGYRFTHIGPVVAPDHDCAVQLVNAALKNCSGSAIIDVPQRNTEWIRWLSSIGFAELRTLIRMFRGPGPGPAIPERQYAILGPEFG